jgi:hypothetical protein
MPTLRKHYFFELRQRDVARDKLEARRFELAWRAAEQGNVGAMREFARLLERNDMMVAESAVGRSEPAKREGPETPKGKKEHERAKALEVDADLMRELEAEALASDARH